MKYFWILVLANVFISGAQKKGDVTKKQKVVVWDRTTTTSRLCLGGDLGLSVGDLDTELLGAGDDLNALSRGDTVGDPAESRSVSDVFLACISASHSLRAVAQGQGSERGTQRLEGECILCGESLVVHEEEVDLGDVVDEEGLVA